MNDTNLIAHVQELLRREAALDIEVLAALNQMHARKLWRGQGFRSFHAFCVAVLKMSEDSAARRLQVAELLARYPEVLRPLILERRVHLSGLSLLYPLIDDDNAERLLNEAAGKSRRQIEEMRARERPMADISSGVRKSSAPVRRKPVAVHAPDRYAFRTMMSAKTNDALARISDMASSKDYEELFVGMVEVYEREMHRRKHAALKAKPKTSKPKAPSSLHAASVPAPVSAPNASSEVARGTMAHIQQVTSRYIPADVKRAVWERDQGRCTFVGACGRCNATRDIQFHHIVNHAHGGPATVENITLHCKAHNIYQAELDFGADVIAAAIERKAA